MKCYSNAVVEGFAAHDPQLKKTKTGKSICTFSIAVNHFSKSDEPPRVSFIDVETWEILADVCSKNIVKGKRIMVMGSLRQDRWEDDKGKIQSRLKIVATEIRLLENKTKED